MAASHSEALHILVIEDDPADRELIERQFRSPTSLQRPVRLTVVGDASAALAAARQEEFSVILMDHTLPQRTGLELLEELHEAQIEAPIIMVTGTGDEGVAVSALQRGAADYVVKQIGFERALPGAIERVLLMKAGEKKAGEIENRHSLLEAATRQLEPRVDEETRTLRQALQESEALRRVAQALADTRQLRPAVELVARSAAELVVAQAAAVMIRADGDLVLASSSGSLPISTGLRAPDLADRFAAEFAQTATAPLRQKGQELGLLWVGRSRPEAFSRAEQSLLEALADMMAVTIAGVRAQEQLRRKNKARLARGSPQDPPSDEIGPRAEARPRTAPRPPEEVSPEELSVPPFPPALAHLMELMNRDDPDPGAVEEAVGLDPALATRVLKLASAVALGRARPAASLREALMVIGVLGVRNLVFTQFARRLFTRWGPVDRLLWEQSLAAAVGTHLLFERTEPALADDAHLCGLVHNLGEIALNGAHPERYQEVVQRGAAEGCTLFEAERAVFGYTGASLTRRLIAQWTLPPRVSKVLRCWDPEALHGDRMATAMCWASATGLQLNPVWQQLLGTRPEPPWIGKTVASAGVRFGVSAESLAGIREQIVSRTRVLRGLVG